MFNGGGKLPLFIREKTRTIRTDNDALKFDVAEPPNWSYSPGDTIIGNLVRKEGIVSPEAIVKVGLIGRAVTQIIDKGNQGSARHYTGAYSYLGLEQDLLFKGPLHLPKGVQPGGVVAGPLSWPFCVKIPTEPVDNRNRGLTKEISFLPLDKDHPVRHVLPGTFSSSQNRYGRESNSFIEYYLSAQLRYWYGSELKTVTATWPITLRHPLESGVDLIGQLTETSTQRLIQSQRLVPGMRHRGLSFKQKMQKSFGSSKVPEFCFKFIITYPKVIQFGNPEPIPIIFEIEPVPEKTSEEIRDVSQRIEITSVKMSLSSWTYICCPGNFSNTDLHSDTQKSSHDLGLGKALETLESPLEIYTADGKADKPINLGNMFQLTLHRSGLKSGSKNLSLTGHSRCPVLYPDFVTYCIRHKNSLVWEISLHVSGEKHSFTMTTRDLKLISSD
ncbi:hypothetical protein N7474_003037 [Penicillium riverlandense]|uniref:uncharacterized protein n=1 Tax=Penicillium riverlandense TaxID=1903569 RepID=UPI002547F3CA|nr:uncharacterized protein N7474_003037 [Penicillium riverlandense]KAJ5825899.1 hypothetical protein N7474_003037 [Penicillium riverlandense]